LFGSQQLAGDKDAGRDPDRFWRPDWFAQVVLTATARMYRRIFKAEKVTPGLWPVAIDRDNLLYPSDDPDPVRACPEPLVLGNGLGQVKHKGSALMSEAAPLLAAGTFSFDQHLIKPARWDPARGGPAAGGHGTEEGDGGG
jgi:hypothetical protein